MAKPRQSLHLANERFNAGPFNLKSESISTATQVGALQLARVPLDLHGRRIYVEWYPHAPVTPLGQPVYISQFLAIAGLFTE